MHFQNKPQPAENYLLSLHAAIDTCRECERAGYSICKPALMKRGSGQSTVMAIGIAPGKSAIEAKEAFAGNSIHRLLNWFSSAGFGLTEAEFRASIYLTSLNKCAATPDTPYNRQRLWGRCAQFLWQQIGLVQPRLILVLGKEPADMLLGRKGIEWCDVLGMSWSTDRVFDGELFPPIMTNAQWLFMPHPSGLSRTMNDAATSAMVIKSLKNSLLTVEFLSKRQPQ